MSEGFFSEQFRVFLSDNHPDIIAIMGEELEDYIKDKAENAANFYESLVKIGTQPGFALDEAISKLKEGMLFSKFNELNEIVEEYYFDSIENLTYNEKVDFIVKLIVVCDEVFKKYNTSDDFVYDDALTTELLGTIELYLKV